MRPRTSLALALALTTTACPAASDSPPPAEQTDPFAVTVDRAKVSTAPALAEAPPLRLSVQTTALDLVHEQREWRGISRVENRGRLPELAAALAEALALPGQRGRPTLALDLEAKLKMDVVHRVISSASGAGIEVFVALVETGSGPGTIAWQVYRPTDVIGFMAAPNFGLTASFTSAGAFMTLGKADSGVARSLADPSGACPTVPATDGVLDPALLLERVRELPPEVRATLAFRFEGDMTWAKAAPILAALAADGIALQVSVAPVSTDCDDPFLAADYKPSEPERGDDDEPTGER
jgi:hypothetical protein